MRSPILPLGAALILASAGGALLLQQYFFPIPDTRLLADVGGGMELAVVSVSSARSSSLRNAELTTEIINRLPPRIRILILAPDREAFTVVANPWKDRIEFVDMPEKYRLTIWPQDPFLVLHDAGGARLLASPDFARAEDIEMARILSRHLELPVDYASLSFEGGNIVSDERHAFIGANTIRHNSLERNLPEEEIAAIFKRELGKSVVVIGPVPQPVGHIDMMLTPLGNGQLVLADPAWGALLAEQDLQRNPGRVAAFEKRCERDFFGRSDISTLQNLEGETLRPPEIVGTTRFAIEDSRAIAGSLDRVAETLRGLGFEITRVPFLYRKPALPDPIAEGETIPGRPDYPQLTYNNVLLETINGMKTVYLPAYGWQALDRAAREAWQAQGFEVVSIPGFTTTAMYGGALRCSVKVLSRS